MRNIFISKESFVEDGAVDQDAVCFASNPFSGRSYILYELGLLTSTNHETNIVKLF